MEPDTIITQCPDDGTDIRWSDLFAPPRQIGPLVQLHIQCSSCGTRRRMRMHPEDLRQTARRYESYKPQMVGDAVAYFRNILEGLNTVEDIIEWKEM